MFNAVVILHTFIYLYAWFDKIVQRSIQFSKSITQVSQRIRNALRWRHDEHVGVSNHQSYDCLLTPLSKCITNQNSASLAFVRGIHRWPTSSPQKRARNAENICSKFCLTTCIMTLTHISLPAVVRYLHCLYLCTLINPPKGESAWVCYLHCVYRSVASLWTYELLP